MIRHKSFRPLRSRIFVAIPLATLVIGWGLTGANASAIEAKPFGIAKFTMRTIERTTEVPTGPEEFEFTNVPYQTPFTQAGGHPWALATSVEFDTEEIQETGEPPGTNALAPTREVKDAVGSLPPGLLGNPMAVSRCPVTLATSGEQLCPADTQVGVYSIQINGGSEAFGPIVDVTPEKGQSAEFALENTYKIDTPLLTARLVHTSQGYGFAVVSGSTATIALAGFELTFWGVPADPSHNAMRGRICRRVLRVGKLTCQGGGEHSGLSPIPFLTMPTDCSAGPETASVRADSWQEPGSVREGQYTGYVEAQVRMPGATGCNLLQFLPEIAVAPDTELADEPAGLGVDLHVPLDETPESNATPQLRDSVLTLPEGMSVSPGVVDGIQACNEFGPEGINITGPESEEIALNGQLQLAPGHCPEASTVGTATAITPFLPVPIEGHVYLARPGCGGQGQHACTEQDALDGNLYRLYLELGGTGELADTGVHFKVPLQTEANPATGQLTTRVVGTPQAPFSDLKIHLNGGPRAPLDNPAACGPATTSAEFTPWSTPGVTPEGLSMAGTPDATPSSFFDVSGCASSPGLNPGFIAGTVTSQAGAFSPFTMNLTRQDREQYVKVVQVHTPSGLLGMLSSVPLCGESEAEDGACPETSKIGTTRVASGAGSHPFEIGGNVYLTGPYRGAPFGLSIVTNAVAGPFNLGLVVVRARINVDPNTSELTITTDESGPHAIPQLIFGVPLRLQRVTVNVDRSKFMFNPTNCAPLRITAKVAGTLGATANVSSPFAVGGCKSLAFKPKFTVSTNGQTSRIKGASLDAKVAYPAGSFGKATNIAKVKVDLPRQLPSRLTTLQKACPSATFESNPANCPPGSIVGVVRTKTQLLPVELTGPVYFVSHGGEAFPSLIMVLQGDNVRVNVTGTTFISKAGITSTTLKTVPDVPFESFELYLPQGKNSALAVNGNLCKSQSKLKMPTEFIAQNGAVVKQTTKIAVTGCKAPRARKANNGSKRGAGK